MPDRLFFNSLLMPLPELIGCSLASDEWGLIIRMECLRGNGLSIILKNV